MDTGSVVMTAATAAGPWVAQKADDSVYQSANERAGLTVFDLVAQTAASRAALMAASTAVC